MNIRDIRHREGLTMKQVAEMSNVSEAAISLIERGKRIPNLQTAKNIADALNVSLDELIKGVES